MGTRFSWLGAITQITFQQFSKEVILWNSLSHPNVLELLGVLGGIEQYLFATVSEWMVHGNIMQYVRNNATNRLALVRISAFRGQCYPTEPLQQLSGAVQGLKYLHDANLTHGDLKGVRASPPPDLPATS